MREGYEHEARDDFDAPEDNESAERAGAVSETPAEAAAAEPAQREQAGRPVGLLTTVELLDELETVERDLAALQAHRYSLLAEIEARGPGDDTMGLTAAGWLVVHNLYSARRAKIEVRLAQKIVAEPVLTEALRDGRVSTEQAERIGHGLARVTDDVDTTQRSAVAEQLVGFAAEFGPDGLSRLVNRAVEVVAPEVAEAADQEALERLEREQRRGRYVSLRQHPDGMWRLAGGLPAVPGAQLAAILTAEATRHVAADDELTYPQAMADALPASR